MGNEERKYRDWEEAERRKKEVGMAPVGSDQYYRNANYILKSFTHPNEETREKRKWLDENGY